MHHMWGRNADTWLAYDRSIGLAHASYLDSKGNNVEYGDCSSPMGCGTTGVPSRSLNPPPLPTIISPLPSPLG